MTFSKITKIAPKIWIFKFSISRVERLRLNLALWVGVGIGEGVKRALMVLFGAGITIRVFFGTSTSALTGNFSGE